MAFYKNRFLGHRPAKIGTKTVLIDGVEREVSVYEPVGQYYLSLTSQCTVRPKKNPGLCRNLAAFVA